MTRRSTILQYMTEINEFYQPRNLNIYFGRDVIFHNFQNYANASLIFNLKVINIQMYLTPTVHFRIFGIMTKI